MFELFLYNHTGRILSLLEATEKTKFPSHDTVLHAYIHFEALTNHDYMYSCINCGYYPKVVIMDLHKKGVFTVPFSEIKTPPEDFEGNTNIVSFWEQVTQEMLNHALMETGPANEFLASVGTTVLSRMDFLTLGHQREVEATVRCS
ncbi:hypothetical protein cypCar_00045495 [Cyprinus carpio]|nr:hypothetical protein cypCar_00045495 [Cyprinus carpio]